MSLNGISSRALLAVTLALGACGREPLIMEPADGGGAAGETTANATGGTTGGATSATGGHATGGHATGGYATGGYYGTGGYATGGYFGTGGYATGGYYGTGGYATGGYYGTGGYATGGYYGTGGYATGGYAPVGGTSGAPGPKGGAVATGGTRPTGGAAGVGGAGGTRASGGAGGTVSCTDVVCAPIPSTCKKLVQTPGACCPTCADPGCRTCPALLCPAGTHQETAAGECCPSCVDDPATVCARGQKEYTNVRQQMWNKYSSTGCKNSSECTLVLEANACAYVCNVPLPKLMSADFAPNLASMAAAYCANCSAPIKTACPVMVPSCVNSKCVAVELL